MTPGHANKVQPDADIGHWNKSAEERCNTASRSREIAWACTTFWITLQKLHLCCYWKVIWFFPFVTPFCPHITWCWSGTYLIRLKQAWHEYSNINIPTCALRSPHLDWVCQNACWVGRKTIYTHVWLSLKMIQHNKVVIVNEKHLYNTWIRKEGRKVMIQSFRPEQSYQDMCHASQSRCS